MLLLLPWQKVDDQDKVGTTADYHHLPNVLTKLLCSRWCSALFIEALYICRTVHPAMRCVLHKTRF
jgi:uncharacterized protein YchJ